MSASQTLNSEILSGVEALVRLFSLRRALDEREGLDTGTFVSGYPGSPLGGVDLLLESQPDLMERNRIVHRPGVNEELAAAAIWGSQMGRAVDYVGVDGVAGAWYGKTPGLDRCGDVLRHANAMGAGPNGGFVLFCGDDPTAKSSTLPCDSQYTFEDACIPVLYPGNQQELIDMGVHAFRLSRFAGPLVGVKVVTSVADGIGSVDLTPDRHSATQTPDVSIGGKAWRHEPLPTIGPHQVPDQELLVVRNRLAATKAYVRANGLDRIVGTRPRATFGIVCAGKTYYDVIQALSGLGIGAADLASSEIRILKLAMTYPVVEETVREFARSVESLLVVEEKRPFIETQLRAILHEANIATPLAGKRDGEGRDLSSSVGELGADDIAAILVRAIPGLSPCRAAVPAANTPAIPIPPRPPAFCSGCPHNRSTVAPEGALAGGGVGCHGIMYFEARQRELHKLPPPPMGAEGVPWIGLSPFVSEPHLIQNLGDGTLSHSGILAIRASIAAGVNTTYKILYNKAVAMTGGQDIAGIVEVPALTRQLEAEGVARIVVCSDDPARYGENARWAPGVDLRQRDDLQDVQKSLRDVPGVTAIIYDQQCAAEARRLRKRGQLETPPARVVINPAVCEGCGDCVAKSNCSSVQALETEFGEKKRIDQLTCNRDYTCVEGECPSFVTITSKGPQRAGASNSSTNIPVALPSGKLPMPSIAEISGQYGIYFTGIGGTGVVTANRILAAAAKAAGLCVAGLDQTGLSQRGGAVVSHLRLARTPEELGSPILGQQDADLYLSGDILQVAQPAHLAKIRAGSTVAAIESEVTPTAAMTQAGIAAPSRSDLRNMIEARVADGQCALVDARRIADAVFNDAVMANMVLIGAAFQMGGLPFSLDAMQASFEAQGKSAARNRMAFEWGRWAAHDPGAIESALAEVGQKSIPVASAYDPSTEAIQQARGLLQAPAIPGVLWDIVERRTAQIIDYQDGKLARRYLDLVTACLAKDAESRDWAITRAVIDGWFKMLACKDEYEVARLHCATDYDAIARDLGIEGGYTVRYHLHPQQLRQLGFSRKVALGKPFAVMFKVLRRLQRLRGTPFDPFGWDADRKLERAIAREYEAAVHRALGELDYEASVAVAASALAVKGYGTVKERNAANWRETVSGLFEN